MSSSPNIATRLGRLSGEDRSWLLSQLSHAERMRLQSIMESDSGATARSSTSSEGARSIEAGWGVANADPTSSESRRFLESVDVRLLAHLLASEPAWITVVILRAHEWSWKASLLDALPQPVSRDVRQLESSNPGFATTLTDAVLRAVVTRLQGPRDVPGISKFDALATKLAARRSRRRWSVRL